MFRFALVSAIASCCQARRTFGASFKFHQADGSLWPSGQELDVLNHTCEVRDSDPELCVMHHFWAGGSFQGYEQSVLRYYADGESDASVVIPFSLGLGSDMLHKNSPWSAGALFGKTGEPSGVFHNYLVPFSKSMRVTVELGGSGKQKFWIILKGTAGVRPRIGGEALPMQARARTFWQTPAPIQASERLALFESEARDGAVLMTALYVNWTNPGLGESNDVAAKGNGKSFLEGCIRGEDTDGQLRDTFSSGTEDYFLGTYYFNRGQYANPVAGLTDLDNAGHTFSAYRIHDIDPLFFEDGLRLTWRNSDPYGVCDLGTSNGDAHAVTASTFAFAYEWTAESSAVV